MSEKKCSDLVEQEFQDRMTDLRRLVQCEYDGTEDEDLGSLNEYRLCFDYVKPETFDDQIEGYFRYQLSWGGPSDEFRIFVNTDGSPHRIEYWYLDWFEGAHVRVTGEDFTFLVDDILCNFDMLNTK